MLLSQNVVVFYNIEYTKNVKQTRKMNYEILVKTRQNLRDNLLFKYCKNYKYIMNQFMICYANYVILDDT